MLTPLVWVAHAPDDAVHVTTASEAAPLVKNGIAVCLGDYQSGIRTLILLGAPADRALHLANVAREQPQTQESYSTPF